MIASRLIALINVTCPNERTKYKDFSEATGIKKETIRALCNERQKFNTDHLQAIGDAFPQYKHWLVFGEELPKSGQISPLTEKIPTTG
ncbi:helix-turn-helix domain-containing protein [Pseudoteredinibacter isoporae]|uniref:HTH cro/C1-type domain-containing protein n=1 Tax=Pseudoteredinibacter isoporae TaxID=570281 RepID=A0A7X0JX55_9GAMM|nr:hypothetical protein [Pseudoteredinibacter isoporae]